MTKFLKKIIKKNVPGCSSLCLHFLHDCIADKKANHDLMTLATCKNTNETKQVP